MSNATVTADHIVQLGKAFRASKALFSAVELGVFSALAKGPRDLEALRIEVGVSERGARDFFDSLVALNLLERDGGGRYRNTPEADLYLDREKPTYIGGELDHFNKRGYPHWHSLTAALKTGKPQSVASAGNYFLDVYSDQSALETYTEGMTAELGSSRRPSPRNFPGTNTERSSISARHKADCRSKSPTPTPTSRAAASTCRRYARASSAT